MLRVKSNIKAWEINWVILRKMILGREIGVIGGFWWITSGMGEARKGAMNAKGE
jgi:hypothetical protein